MKEGAADITDALLPPEDGAVARALTDLKAKLSTWTAAVASVQNALTAQAAKLTEMDAARQRAPDSAAPQEDAAKAAHDEAECRQCVEESNDRDAAVSVAEPTTSSPDLKDDGYQTQAYAEELSPTEAGNDDPAGSLQPKSFGESHATAQDSVDEDQTLLESLDEKMAEAIRVQFRLFDGKKSIRELIDAYEEVPEEPQKSSWWQRVKG